MKPITFLGDSLTRLRDFPDDARSEAGYQLRAVQAGDDPADWKPMRTQQTPQKDIEIAAQRFRAWKD